MSASKVKQLIQRLEDKERRGLAKAITFVENQEAGVAELMNHAYRNMNDHALVIGVTGPGGAGKSTLVDKVIKHCRRRGHKVGVIAVDPSSPYTGGAFLGDRIRMGAHNTDLDVFIRSFGSRGSMGGISQGTKRCLYLFKNYDFDLIIIESLGIGQDETEITNFVDVTVVTVVPGYGDAIQIAKAGMQEIADIFVVNKADKPEAEEFYLQMANSLHLIPEELRPIMVKTVATTEDGIPELLEVIEKVGLKQRSKRRAKAEIRIKAEIETEVFNLIRSRLAGLIEDKAMAAFSGQATPFEISAEIAGRINIA
ncbi:MAG: methylmalonyl Co-A mutase-associated GTPase MeaB [Candidatus Adiutrix sp.]|jgi:LAO/AO transport system kinase|nr:methylmalonyl Co-A mutase-associated GTPase MeaB [Candidatus Adiutrix sp.]